MNQEPIASVHAGGGRASSAQVDRAVADGRTQEGEQRQTARIKDKVEEILEIERGKLMRNLMQKLTGVILLN